MNVPKIRFSPKYATGTFKERMRFADELNDRLFSSVYSLYKNSLSVPICDIERTMKEIIPEPIYFNVKENNDRRYQHFSGYLKTRYINNKPNSYE